MVYTKSTKKIKDNLKELHDIVVPTMGARGRLAVLSENMDKPTLTDDGVTVIKQCRHMKDWGKMISMGVIEAAHNTEKEAYDGTTLTVLMTYQLYNYGYWQIKRGRHPQVVADEIQKTIAKVLKDIEVIEIDSAEQVEAIANISTKIPELGAVIRNAYKVAGDDMNIVIEHDRENEGFNIEYEQGYGIESGYFSEAMKAFCNVEGDVSEFTDAKVAILKEGVMSGDFVSDFFGSIPTEEMKKPLVFLIDPSFNPEALRLIIDTVIKNNLIVQFIFVNEPQGEDVFLDVAAVTGGKVQDATGGIKKYTYDMCGTATKIRIERDRSIIIGEGNVDGRLKTYSEKLRKEKYQMPEPIKILTERRYSALSKGITKIKVGVATITEFKTLKLKLDDGIGAVRLAFKKGAVLGGGKCLYNISFDYGKFGKLLRIPLKQICSNAGIKISRGKLKDKRTGIDVTTGKYVDLEEVGILDGAASIQESLKNASSIACNYLRTYVLIKERDD